MITESFLIKDFEVTAMYDCTCDDIDEIINELKRIKCPKRFLAEAFNNLETCSFNIGLTYTNIQLKSSVLVVGRTDTDDLFINTVAHEYYHLICHISKALEITDEEELANLNGNLNMHSYKVLKEL